MAYCAIAAACVWCLAFGTAVPGASIIQAAADTSDDGADHASSAANGTAIEASDTAAVAEAVAVVEEIGIFACVSDSLIDFPGLSTTAAPVVGDDDVADERVTAATSAVDIGE